MENIIYQLIKAGAAETKLDLCASYINQLISKQGGEIDKAVQWLTNTHNKGTRAVFEIKAKVKLPKTQKASNSFLRNYVGMEKSLKRWLTRSETKTFIRTHIGKKVVIDSMKRDWERGRKYYISNPRLVTLMELDGLEVGYLYEGLDYNTYLHIDNIRDFVLDGKSVIGDSKNEEYAKELFTVLNSENVK